MASLAAASLLIVVVFANSICQSFQKDPPTDLDQVLHLFECARQAIITGIPEIGVPTHDPLIIPETFDYSFDLGPNSLTVSLDNLVIEGIPRWNVTQAYQIASEDPELDIFKYTVYWRAMALEGNWKYTVTDASSTVIEENSGSLYVEVDHINFDGIVKVVQPGTNREDSITEFTLDITSEDAQVNVNNLGLLGDLIHVGGGPVLNYLVNHNPIAGDVGEALRQKLITDWVKKPERIYTLLALCQSPE